MTRTEWSERWRALASVDLMAGSEGESRMVDRWAVLARKLDEPGDQRADPVLDFVLERLTPDMTVLDIGAGVGRWTVPLAARARSVTAVEPVEGMRVALTARLARLGVANVATVSDGWMEADVAAHDVAVAAYSMYTSLDIVAFARKMDAAATRFCGMAMRVPAANGVIGELAGHILGDWHDSPNFVVGYNALLEAGMTPNVFVEPVAARHWTDPSLDDAVARARRHLRLTGNEHDTYIRATLERRLEPTAEGYRWPDWMRAALVWWEPTGI